MAKINGMEVLYSGSFAVSPGDSVSFALAGLNGNTVQLSCVDAGDDDEALKGSPAQLGNVLLVTVPFLKKYGYAYSDEFTNQVGTEFPKMTFRVLRQAVGLLMFVHVTVFA
jgi:hypothetical protein